MRDFINFIVFSTFFVGCLYCFCTIENYRKINFQVEPSPPIFILPESTPITPPKVEPPKEQLNLPARGVVLQGATIYHLRDGKAIDSNQYIKSNVECEVFSLVECEDKKYLVIKITQEGYIPSIFIVERKNVAI